MLFAEEMLNVEARERMVALRDKTIFAAEVRSLADLLT
jgi:hypothetical protein